jgi:hypothetical protein
VVGVYLNLLTKPADMHVDHLWLPNELSSPHLPKQLIYREDPPGLQRQSMQQVKLAPAEVN